MESVKTGRKMFRNIGNRIIYLQPRTPDDKGDFVLGPGETVEALDPKEEMLLASMSYLVDVEKESPAISNSLDLLRKQLADEQKKNAELRKEKEALEEQVGKTDKLATAHAKKGS